MPRHDPSASQSTGRVRVGDGLRLVAAWTVSSLTLILADALQPNLSAESSWAFVAVAAIDRRTLSARIPNDPSGSRPEEGSRVRLA